VSHASAYAQADTQDFVTQSLKLHSFSVSQGPVRHETSTERVGPSLTKCFPEVLRRQWLGQDRFRTPRTTRKPTRPSAERLPTWHSGALSAAFQIPNPGPQHCRERLPPGVQPRVELPFGDGAAVSLRAGDSRPTPFSWMTITADGCQAPAFLLPKTCASPICFLTRRRHFVTIATVNIFRKRLPTPLFSQPQFVCKSRAVRPVVLRMGLGVAGQALEGCLGFLRQPSTRRTLAQGFQ
jgi:hypothetical protein